MLKRYTFWLWTAVVFQLLTAFFHSISLFVTPAPENEIQRQMIELMSHKMDMGGGFHPSMANLVTALSSCFTFLALLGGMINAFLLRKKAPLDIIRGIVTINILVFGACFAVMTFLTFLPPIILTGLIFISLILAFVLMQSRPQESAPVE